MRTVEPDRARIKRVHQDAEVVAVTGSSAALCAVGIG